MHDRYVQSSGVSRSFPGKGVVGVIVRRGASDRRTVAWAFLSVTLVILAVSRAEATELSAVYDAALAGDMAKGLSILDSVDPSRMDSKDSTAAACLRQTFTTPPRSENLPPRTERILHAYRLYWQSSMVHRVETAEAEQTLLDSLNAILMTSSDDRAATLDDASERARLAIWGEGLFALAGVTSPFYEMMIWRTQSRRTYHVKLPGRSVDVPVVFLDDFASLGWAGYATCGRSHSGGWATQDSLFALRSAYDLESENFRVSYLAHEGTHFADYKSYPKLQQPELEYRAKLTELALSEKTTHDLITGFARRNGLDRSVPHHFASYWVTADMSRAMFRSDSLVTDPDRWRRTPPERIRSEAKKLLESINQRLEKLGPRNVERFLPDSRG